MSLLGGLTTDYGEDQGSFIISSLITKGVYAINDVDDFYNPIDLQLGTNGGINIVVGTDNNINKPDKCLTIIDNYKEQHGIYNFQVYGSNAIALSPADENTTVYIGDAIFYSDTDYVYLTSYTKKLALVTDEIELGGSLHSLNDLKIDGEMYTGEINITHQVTEDDLLGYAFRVNPNNMNLELVKYFNASTPGESAAQLVASFGQGPIVNDSNYSFNTYNSTGNTMPITEFETTDPTNGGGNASNGGGGYWYANGNDIHFGNYGGTAQRVGIMTENPTETLDVVGTIKGSKLTDGDIEIFNGYIAGIKTIEVNVLGDYSGIKFRNINGLDSLHIWNGHASNVYGIKNLPLSFFKKDMTLGDFYTGTKTTWFDDITSNIPLSSFSNDIIDFGGHVTFCNVTVTDTLTAVDTSISNLIVDDAVINTITIDTATVSNIQIQETLSAPTITTNSISVTDSINVNNTITSSSIQTTNTTTTSLTTDSLNVLTSLDASSITALINKLVADEVSTRLATISGTLSVANLTASNVSSSLVPDQNEVYDLGTPEKKWRDLYLSGNTLNIDTMSIQTETHDNATHGVQLNIHGGDLAMERLNFRDGTSLGSTNEIVTAINEGESFGDFSGFTMSINTTRNTAELFSGSFIYSSAHNIAQHGNRWKVCDFGNHDILPILEDGSGVNFDNTTIVKTGGMPKDVQLSFIHRGRFIGNNVYFSHEAKSNINDLFPIRNFDPYSRFFKNKCKTDFNYYFNVLEVANGFKSPGKTIYFDMGSNLSNQYVQINDIYNFNNRNSGNKFYDIEFLYYFKVPLYDLKFIVEDMSNKYLVSNYRDVRINQAYVYDEELDTYTLQTINEKYGLYPRISIKKWDNSVNNTEFSDVIYNTTMGWGTPDITTVFDRFKENGWLLQLFKLTYKYIMYGHIVGSHDEYDTVVDEYLNTLFEQVTTDDITFVDEEHLTSIDGDIVPNNTTICFRKNIFEQLLTTPVNE